MSDPNATIGAKARTTLLDIVDLLDAIYHQWLEPLAESCWHSAADAIYLNTRPGSGERLWRATHDCLMRIERRLETFLPRSLHFPRPIKTLVILLIMLLLLLWSDKAGIEEIKAAGRLVVVTPESPTTWYQGGDGPEGPEYEYLASFADFLGVELALEPRRNRAEALAAVAGGDAHLAAGMTYFPPLEDRGIAFGPPYQRVDVHVVCRRGQKRQPKELADLARVELVVVADSPYESRLFELQRRNSELAWQSEEDASVDELLELVWRREIDCTIANSSELAIKRRYYPELRIAFTLAENQALAWALSPEYEALSDAIEQWLEMIDKDGTLSILRDRHHQVEEFDYVDMRIFIRRIRSRLPQVEPLFRKAAEKHEMPWTFLAAVSYQESHWNRRAKSPTGVRGIMMLTLDTAREMGVESRLDAEQSIMGGAKYLRQLERRIPDGVTGDDRWYFALAAYNMGMGHLHDARELARELALNPDRWIDLRGVLPLLAQRKYHQKLARGYARGHEAAHFVESVRNYESILRAQLARQRGIHGD